MRNVALTGNIASGKSTVARWFSEWGATVIDADEIVRALQRPGSPSFARIVDRFGPAVVGTDGTLDRAALRHRVFGDPKALADLNAIMHPAVAVERDRRARAARDRGASLVISDIPLLFEAADSTGFDAVVLVDAPVEIRRRRLMTDRHLDLATADAMIDAQMSADLKRSRSTYVIDNDTDVATLKRRARQVWNRLVADSVEP